MTCRRIRRLIPLAAGDDLRPRLAASFRAHIDRCPGCREKLEGFRAAMDEIRTAAKAEGAAEWREGEWNALMTRVESAGRSRPGATAAGRRARVFRPSWAAASALGAFLCLIVLAMLFRGSSVRPGRTPNPRDLVAASDRARQDKVAITMVSPETGLQVVWFLDKNFDWKGDQE